MTAENQGRETSFESKYAGQGISESLLSDVETRYRLHIPPTHRAFLKLVGNNPHAVPGWVGSDWAGGSVSEIQSDARDLLTNNPHLNGLPDDAFVLLLHQGYSVLFVHAKLGDGSPVYAYSETDEPNMQAFKKVAPPLGALMSALVPETWQDAQALTSQG